MVICSLQSFGDLLRRYRLAAGLTQEELAAQAGLSVRGLSDLERGARRAPRRETVQLLAEALQLSVAERTRLEAAARQRGAPTVQAAAESVPSPQSSLSALPFVGRAQELALLEQVLADGPPVLLVVGEPGIGKSRLLQAGSERAEAQGWTVLLGGCHRRSGQEPYAPLVGALTDFLRRQSPTELRQHLEDCTWLVRLLPELAESGVLSTPARTLPAEQERRLMFAAVARFLAQVAGPAGTLLVLDDLHWVGPDALDLLQALLRAPAQRPLRLLAAYRDTDVTSQDPLTFLVADLAREGQASRAQLVPLAQEEAAALLAHLLPQTADGDPHLRQQVLERAAGMPLFLVSCVQALLMGSLTWNGSSHVPWTLREAILQRMVALPQTAQQVLRLATVMGRRVPRALLVTVAARSELVEEQVLEALEGCGRGRLLAEASGDAYQFTHDLIREVVLSDLGTARRALLHRTIAETMEQQPPDTLDMHLEDLAYHFYQASVWHKAVDYAQRAGEKALQLYSYHTAIDYFTWALEAVGHLARPAAPLFYRARGQAYETLGEFEQAQQDYIRALDAARMTHDHVAAWQSLIDLGFLWAGRDYAQTGTWFRQALVLSQTLNDPALHARSLNRIGNWHLNVEQPHEALRSHREALTIFEQLHDSRGIAETLDLLGMVSYLGGDVIGGTAYYQQAITLFRELGDKPGLISSLATLTLRAPTYQTDTLVSVASLAEVLPDAEDALRIARQIGHRPAEAYALFLLGLCLGSQGEYGRALTTVWQSLGIAEEIEHRQWQTAAHTALGGIYSGLLAYPQAREHFEQALALACEIGSLFWTRLATGYLASVVILLHDLAPAEKLLHAALSPETPAQTQAQRMVWCACVELALAQGHPIRALGIIDQLITSQAQGAQGQSSLRVLKLRGEALVALQQADEAEVAFKAAQELAAAQGARPVQWRIGIALGKLSQAQGRKTEAEQAFATARTLIEELSATIVEEPLREHFWRQATALLPQVPPLSPDHSTKQAFGGLTTREREVASLIAQGKSNQTIAEVLVVTKRTVETQIGTLMFKLGCTSRTQIAGWAVETGLVSKAETERRKGDQQ